MDDNSEMDCKKDAVRYMSEIREDGSNRITRREFIQIGTAGAVLAAGATAGTAKLFLSEGSTSGVTVYGSQQSGVGWQ